ncbi:MAG: sigma-54 factor interaction domain-containing protein, partial [Myxococcota bacterium]
MPRTDDRQLARVLLELGRVNPFLPERRGWERRALGDRYVADGPLGGPDDPNDEQIALVAEEVVDRLRRRLLHTGPSPEDRELYGAAVFMALYHRHAPSTPPPGDQGEPAAPEYPRFVADFERLFSVCGPPDPTVDTPEHLFACFWQIRRAYAAIFSTIIGASSPVVRLRAAVWQSVFSFDAVRYRRMLFRAMPDIPTLVTGPTGTGKELVARAIGLSGYVPFDARERRFAHPPTFLPLNLQALSSSLVESELFGHRKGSFTGAIADRDGWLAVCPRGGTVFLDEIGELDPLLQVKLLRVLDDRTFTPVGDTRPKRFAGKIVAATNRDLPAMIGEGTFRADLYYRLCGDRVVAPSLRERLDADPAERGRVLAALLGRWIDRSQVPEVVAEVEAEIGRSRGPAWPWPGNVRELAQCARNVLVQGTCGPPEPLGRGGPADAAGRDPDGPPADDPSLAAVT